MSNTFCQLKVVNDTTIEVTKNVQAFIDSIMDASYAVTYAIKDRTYMDEMLVILCFAEDIQTSADFCSVSAVGYNEGELPRVITNTQKQSVQCRMTGLDFNDIWYHFADELRNSVQTRPEVANQNVKIVFNSVDNSICFSVI